MIRTHLRTSRKLRRCGCGTWIHAGDQYLLVFSKGKTREVAAPAESEAA